MAAGAEEGLTRWMRQRSSSHCCVETDTGRVPTSALFACVTTYVTSVTRASGVSSGCLQSAVGITLRREGDVRTENSPLLMTVSVRWTFVRSKVEYHQTYPT